MKAIKSMNLLKKIGLFLSTFYILPFVSFANAETKVATSIKPLHSLVSYVMEGVGTPDIIIDGSSSPHTFQLKPSHASMLQEADIIFWIGEDLEVFLETPLDSIAKNVKRVTLMDSNEIDLLKFREKNVFDDHEGHDEHDEHEDSEHDEHEDSEHDEHEDSEHDEHEDSEHDE